MPKQSAGLLLYRHGPHGLEVFLVHPGGPYWAKRDDGAWSIPKGEYDGAEEPLAAAMREFEEETGFAPPAGKPLALEPVRQAGGKVVCAWAVQHDLNPAEVRSQTFSMEWPPRSGTYREFPEVDRGAWFSLEEAGRKILAGQAGLLAQLAERVGAG